MSVSVVQRMIGSLVVSIAITAISPAQPVTLVPGTIVTGVCQGHAAEPGCVLPNLFGPQGLTLANNPQFPHYAHFTGSAQEILNQGVGTAIATQLAILPIISPSSGFTFTYDKASGVFVRSTTSFGPIYTERADTIGRGKISFGLSYQRFRFSSLDGIDIHNIPAVFTHVPGTGPGGANEPYEADVIRTSNNLDLNMDQTMLYGTVGITNHLDISLAVPVISVRFGATSQATIVQVSGPTFVVAPGVPPVSNPHQFASGGLTNTYSSTGTAFGIGDVTVRLKQTVFQAGGLNVAAALDIRTPTGNAREFLGSGALGIKPFVAISGGKRFSPHANLGYQWNGSSVLAGNLTGTTVGETNEMATIQTGPPSAAPLPSQYFYSVGADYGATKRLTLNSDYLGQVLVHAPRVFESSITTQAIPGGTGAVALPSISAGNDTIGFNNAAIGFKYNFVDRFLLTADLLFPLDNKGLRQDVTPLIGISYAF
ncbi:MAG TPA: transporter [Bryobacteraceae bacterium]|nr:transporter [Bryobacteraceae bacterium]